MTLFDGEGSRDGSGDGDRAFRRRFPGEVGGGTREREGVVGSRAIAGGSVLGGFVGLGFGVFQFELNGWRSRLGVMISTASMIILGLTGVVGLDGTDCGAGPSSSPGSSSSTTIGTFFFVERDRVVLAADFEGPTLAWVVRMVVRADVLEGGLAGGSLVAGGFSDGGFERTTCFSASAGRVTPGGLPRRLGATVVSTSIGVSTSVTTIAAFLVACFGRGFSVLDGPVTALDRVALASGFFFVGGSGSLDSCSALAVRRVVRAVARDLEGLAGVTGPSDRSLRREGSDGRGSAGAFRFGGILSRAVALRGFDR